MRGKSMGAPALLMMSGVVSGADVVRHDGLLVVVMCVAGSCVGVCVCGGACTLRRLDNVAWVACSK